MTSIHRMKSSTQSSGANNLFKCSRLTLLKKSIARFCPELTKPREYSAWTKNIASNECSTPVLIPWYRIDVSDDAIMLYQVYEHADDARPEDLMDWLMSCANGRVLLLRNVCGRHWNLAVEFLSWCSIKWILWRAYFVTVLLFFHVITSSPFGQFFACAAASVPPLLLGSLLLLDCFVWLGRIMRRITFILATNWCLDHKSAVAAISHKD